MMEIHDNIQSPKPRRSVFQEVGLFDGQAPSPPPNFEDLITARSSPTSRSRSRTPPIESIKEEDEPESRPASRGVTGGIVANPSRHNISRTRRTRGLFFRVAFFTLIAALLLQISTFRSTQPPFVGVSGSPFDSQSNGPRDLVKRADSPTDVCKRWSQQSAVVNGTLYLYGGRATTSSDQTSNTWSESPAQ
jgi:hypothetical protein